MVSSVITCTCNNRASLGCAACGWFTTIAWNEREYWQESHEPLDPDDIWRIGDRVQWKGGLKQRGTVKGVKSHDFLGGKLWLVIVRFDEAANDVEIEPEQFWRLWDDTTPLFNVGDYVEFNGLTSEILAIKEKRKKAELFVSVSHAIWVDFKLLKLANSIRDEYGVWWQVSMTDKGVPQWHNPMLEVLEHDCGESYVVLERSNNEAKVIRVGLRPQRPSDNIRRSGSVKPFWVKVGK